MRFRLIRRIVASLFLFAAFFFIIVGVQFTRETHFSRRVGSFVVAGEMRETENSGFSQQSGYVIDDMARVSFGGLDFILSNDEPGHLILIDDEDNEAALSVYSLTVSDDAAHFLLSDGVELIFYTQRTSGKAGADGILISVILPEKAAALRIPYTPSSNSRIRDTGVDWILSLGAANYAFDRPAIDSARRSLVLRRSDPMVVYRELPESGVQNKPEKAAGNKAFVLTDYIVRGAMEKTVYEEQLRQWQEKVYGIWARTISAADDEELVMAFLAEAGRRGAYMSALQLIPESFRLTELTYLSSPYLGRLDRALETLSEDLRAESARFTTQIRETPRVLLEGSHVFKYWTLSGGANLIEERGMYARAADPASLSFYETAGIIESSNDWAAFSPNSENPFGHLVPRALELITAGLIKDETTSSIFVLGDAEGSMNERTVDTEYNIRLALVLAAYGDRTGDSGWAGIGRSLALSILSLTDDNAALPRQLIENGTGSLEALPDDGEIVSAARLYAILMPSPYYPRAAGLDTVQTGLWVWTASPSVRGVFQNNILDITVNFPVGWSHHLLIRGVSPFNKIQLRDVDYRSDPRFEQYNTHGWRYSAAEQTLQVKIVQRAEEEHIRIFY
jgi:hypothetical protein